MGGVWVESAQTQVLRHLRIAAAVARQWHTPYGSGARHALRVQRLRATWPDLATALDGLVESLPDAGTDAAAAAVPAAPCPVCERPVTRVTVITGQSGVRTNQAWPCNHLIPDETVAGLTRQGAVLAGDQAPTGVARIAAAAQLGNVAAPAGEGGDGALAWAVWCVLDRMDSPGFEGVPPMWPWPAHTWPPVMDRESALAWVGALCAAEIDRPTP